MVIFTKKEETLLPILFLEKTLNKSHRSYNL